MGAVASVKHCIDKGTVLLFPSPLIHENTGDRNKRTVPLNYQVIILHKLAFS